MYCIYWSDTDFLFQDFLFLCHWHSILEFFFWGGGCCDVCDTSTIILMYAECCLGNETTTKCHKLCNVRHDLPTLPCKVSCMEILENTLIKSCLGVFALSPVLWARRVLAKLMQGWRKRSGKFQTNNFGIACYYS